MNDAKARTARGDGDPASERRGAGEGPPRQNEDELVDFAEITEIELRVLRRMSDEGVTRMLYGLPASRIRSHRSSPRLGSRR